jgi:hypothetical protein
MILTYGPASRLYRSSHFFRHAQLNLATGLVHRFSLLLFPHFDDRICVSFSPADIDLGCS